MQTDVRRFDIATYPNGRHDMCDFTGMSVKAAMGLVVDRLLIETNVSDYSALCDLDCCCSGSCASNSFARCMKTSVEFDSSQKD